MYFETEQNVDFKSCGIKIVGVLITLNTNKTAGLNTQSESKHN